MNIASRTEPNLHQLATRKKPPITPATAVKIRRTEKEKGKFQTKNCGNATKASVTAITYSAALATCLILLPNENFLKKKPNEYHYLCFMHFTSTPVCNWGCATKREAQHWNRSLATMYIGTLSSQGSYGCNSKCTHIKEVTIWGRTKDKRNLLLPV